MLRLTARGQAVLLIAGVLLGLLLGFTAQHWNPFAQPLPATNTEMFEDGAGIVWGEDGERLASICLAGHLCDNSLR